MRAKLFLADWAEAINGKLYIQGGGWSKVVAPTGSISFAIALQLLFEWTEANEPKDLRISLLTEDGHPYVPEGAEGPIEIVGRVEVGRPPGTTHGTPLDSTMAMNLGPLQVTPGRYDIVVDVEGIRIESVAFEVLALPT